MENSFGQNKRAKRKKKSLSDINTHNTYSMFNFHADSFPLDDIFILEGCTRAICHTTVLDSKAYSMGKLCVYV